MEGTFQSSRTGSVEGPAGPSVLQAPQRTSLSDRPSTPWGLFCGITSVASPQSRTEGKFCPFSVPRALLAPVLGQVRPAHRLGNLSGALLTVPVVTAT